MLVADNELNIVLQLICFVIEKCLNNSIKIFSDLYINIFIIGITSLCRMLSLAVSLIGVA